MGRDCCISVRPELGSNRREGETRPNGNAAVVSNLRPPIRRPFLKWTREHSALGLSHLGCVECRPRLEYSVRSCGERVDRPRAFLRLFVCSVAFSSSNEVLSNDRFVDTQRFVEGLPGFVSCFRDVLSASRLVYVGRERERGGGDPRLG